MTEEILFAEALEKSPEERPAFLDEACGGDTELRQRVEQLLRSSEEAGSFLAQSAAEDFDATLDISVDDQALIESRSSELRKTQAAKQLSEKDSEEKEPPSVKVVVEPNGKRILYFGDYELQGEIARGAMGVVYRGEQKSLKRTVAIKMIRSTMLTNEMDVIRFKAEAEAAASLDHPNIVPIYEVGMHEEQHYFTMKLIEGGTLRDHLERLQKEPKAAAKLMSTVAGAIHAAHQRGILHRDLKPGNILVDEDGEPHVTDFGLAKQMESNSSVTLSGQIMGTPQYMAPEQAEGGGRELTTAADVYGLGAMFYEMLCGKPPHVGSSLMDTLKLVAEEEAAPPSKHNPKVDRDLETIAMKCLEKDPAKRYASSQGLKNDLNHWLRGEPILARPVGTAEKVIKWMKRKPMHAAAAGLGVLFLLTLGIGGPVAAFQQSKLRGQADDSRKVADEAREEAESSRDVADRRGEQIRRTLYASEMNAASSTALDPAALPEIQASLLRWKEDSGAADLRDWEWYFLHGLAERRGVRWSRQFEFVQDVSCRPGGATVAVVSGGVVQLCDMTTGADVAKIDTGAHVYCFSWSPSGAHFVVSDPKGAVRIFDADEGREIRRLEEDASARVDLKHGISWSPDGRWIAARLARGFAVWDAESGKLLDSPDGMFGLDLAWSPDEPSLFVAQQQKIHRWNPGTAGGPDLLGNFGSFARGQVARIAVRPGGRMLAASGVNETLFFINLDGDQAEVSHQLSGYSGEILDLAWSPDDEVLASSGEDRSVRLWDPLTGNLVSYFAGHHDQVGNLDWSPNGEVIVSAGKDGEVLAWNRNDRSFLTRIEGPEGLGPIACSLEWSPDGNTLVGSGLSWLRVCRFGSQSEPVMESIPNRPERGKLRGPAAWSGSDRLWVQQGHPQGKLVSVDVHEGARFEVPLPGELKDLSLSQLAPSPDRRFLAATSWNPPLLWVIDVETNELVWQTSEVDLRTMPAWSPDGAELAFVERESENSIQLVDTDSFQVVRTLDPGTRATSLAFSPDGSRFAFSGADEVIYLYDVESGETLAEMRGHSGEIRDVKWSPDGARLASCGKDRTVRLWDPETGEQVMQWAAFESSVRQIAWSPDGLRLAALETFGRTTNFDAGPGYLKEGSLRALPRLNEQLTVAPDDVEALIARSEIYQLNGQVDLAEQDRAAALASLETRLESDPRNSAILAELTEFAKSEFRRLDEAAWKVIEPGTFVSEGGATLLLQPDGSILAAGKNPDGDAYRITLQPGLPRITALRLETIPDSSLPNGGSGRAPDGNFHLGDVSIEYHVSGNGGKINLMPIGNAWADYHYEGEHGILPIEKAFDKDPDMGWSAYLRHRERNVAVFVFAEPGELTEADEVVVRLKTGTRNGIDNKLNLGRFRLAVTDQPRAILITKGRKAFFDGIAHQSGWTLLGMIRILHEERKEAAEAFGRALDLVGNEDERARVLDEMETDEAVFQMLLEIRPDVSGVVMQQAQDLIQARQFGDKSAIALLSNAMTFEPENLPIRLARGKAYAAAELWREAGLDLAEAFGTDHPVADDFALRADVFEKTRQWDRAISDWKQAVKRKRGNQRFNQRLLTALLEIEDWTEAVEVGWRCMDINPGASRTWLPLGPALILAGDEEGYAAFRKKVPQHIDKGKYEDLDIGLKVCLLRAVPEELMETLPVRELTEVLQDQETSQLMRVWSTAALSLGELRSGNLKEANALAARAIEKDAAWAESSPLAVALALAVRANAEARQGNGEAAHFSLEQSSRILDRHVDYPAYDWLIADILRREAEALIEEMEEN